jgi:hypothetical protein
MAFPLQIIAVLYLFAFGLEFDSISLKLFYFKTILPAFVFEGCTQGQAQVKGEGGEHGANYDL